MTPGSTQPSVTQTSMKGPGVAPEARSFGEGYLFGIPLGKLGWFATMLMGTAAGFAAFFAGTFCGIAGILVWNGAHGAGASQIDYAMSYRRVGFPLGLTVLVVALSVLGTLRVRRMLRKA